MDVSENTQVQGSGGVAQTQNPQQVPGNLQQPTTSNNVQSVVNSTNLFSNPQANAIIVLPGASSNTETLLANETEAPVPNSNNLQTGAVITIVALIILVGAFIVTRKITAAD